MTIRTASLLAAALVAVATPAFAQDGRYHPGPPPPLPEADEQAWDEAWEDDWEEYPDERLRGEDQRWDQRWDPRWDEPRGPRHDGHGDWRGRDLPPLAASRPMGYSAEQRAQWLEQCRATYYDDRGRRRGEVIGGVLGAVAGGVGGNRIAGDGSRLGGTLIGAGVGGLAGAVIGGAAGGESDRDRAERRLDDCEDYLIRYERSYAAPGPGHGASHHAYGYGYPYAPVMWVKVPIVSRHRHGRDCGCETVVEEWIEEEPAPAPHPRVKRVKIQRVAPTPDKRVRVTK